MTAGDRLAGALVTTLEGTCGVASAYLYGSVAAGRAHRESDVDVGVLLDRRVYPHAVDRFEARLRLTGLLQSSAGREVDLVVLNDAPPHLVRHVMTTGLRLVMADADLDHAHLRVMQSRAADLDPFLRRARAVKLAVLAR
jgi:predicted nucleotidyltransferase